MSGSLNSGPRPIRVWVRQPGMRLDTRAGLCVRAGFRSSPRGEFWRSCGGREAILPAFALLLGPEAASRPSESPGADQPATKLERPEPGGVPERPKGTVCKTVGSAYAGSNPASPIEQAGFGAWFEPRSGSR